MLEPGLGVTTALLLDRENVSQSIRVNVRVRFTMNRLTERKDGIIDLGEVEEYND